VGRGKKDSLDPTSAIRSTEGPKENRGRKKFQRRAARRMTGVGKESSDKRPLTSANFMEGESFVEGEKGIEGIAADKPLLARGGERGSGEGCHDVPLPSKPSIGLEKKEDSGKIFVKKELSVGGMLARITDQTRRARPGLQS